MQLTTRWVCAAAVALAVAGLAAARGQATRGAGGGAAGVPVPAGAVPGSMPAGCCGVRMGVEGELFIYEAPETVTDGQGNEVKVAAGCRVECFGNVMVVKGDVPAGRYRVEVVGSENSFTEAGKRVFDVTAVGGTGAAEKKTVIGTNIDLFALGGGMGKAVTVKGEVLHGGGPLKVVFTAKVDSAKFSAVRVMAVGGPEEGDRAAWVFAEDVAAVLRLPGDPPAVAGPEVWKDVAASPERRAADLVRRMTLREKVWQMSHTAPAVERLGVPAYNYWSEGLHGVARNGIATVFPQAIGMAASFDPALVRQVGDVISTEARAKFNGWQAAGGAMTETGGLYQGLTFWSPNINLFRDPRWGRGHETYGEDPLLTGRMGVAFITGMQGDDPKYLKVAATAKHFAVHSGPESLRHVFDVRPPARDLYESYLPQFEMAVKEGKVASVMGAYNRVYGEPACGSELLLKQILRKEWGFQGYVVSDCWAIADIWANHKVAANQAEAAAMGVLAGCDLECGQEYGSLGAAVDLNLVGEGAVDAALTRVLASRFRLGLFDPAGAVRWAGIRPEENDTPAHRALALTAARESMVLLKNDGVLPLDAGKVKKVAVVGPNGDGLLPLLGNYNGTPSKAVTVVEGIRAAVGGAGVGGTVVYVKGCESAARAGADGAAGAWQVVPDVCVRPDGAGAGQAGAGGETGFVAEYFGTGDLSGRPVAVRNEKSVDIHGAVEWTVPVLGAAAVRWRGAFVAPADGTYRLAVGGLSPYRWQVNGQSAVDVWELGTQDPTTLRVVQLTLKAGEAAPMALEARADAGGRMDVQLYWDRADVDVAGQVVERVKDADVIVFAGGLDGHMEAEEGDLRGLFVGFAGGDRETIEMPAGQTALMKALVATGKPVVLVNMTGSAVAMPWEAEHVGAIVQAWYPGEMGGQAVAEVLFGAHNPAGRLPVTFYKATAELPAFTDYGMAAGTREAGGASPGRTYRYFTGVPQWAFGHGLSYTTFRYGGMAVDRQEAGAADTLKVSVDVLNTGTRDGDDVVQVYAAPLERQSGDALRRLVGFARVHLAAGKGTRVEVTVPVGLLRVWEEAGGGRYVVRPGKYVVQVGRSSMDIRGAREVVVK